LLIAYIILPDMAACAVLIGVSFLMTHRLVWSNISHYDNNAARIPTTALIQLLVTV